MQTRTEIVDKNFAKAIESGKLPSPKVDLSLAESGLTKEKFLDLFESQILSRHTDYSARLLKDRNESFYTIGSSGHEGNAAVAAATRHTDMAFLHYRSGAFFIQRAKQLPGSTPIYDLMLSLAASSDDPISGGRHKVFGSLPLFIPPQTSTIASHLPKAVGAAMSIRRASDMKIESNLAPDSIVICSFGDASANHATALSAFNAASFCGYNKIPAPVLFVCEDNGIGISVRTPEGWVARRFAQNKDIRYFWADGRNLAHAFKISSEAAHYVRSTRMPAFLHLETVRLFGHAGSDVESLYHTIPTIEKTEFDDPILHSAKRIVDEGILSAEELVQLYEDCRTRVARVGEFAIQRPKLLTRKDVMLSVVPPKKIRPMQPAYPEVEELQKIFGSEWNHRERPYHLAKLLNWGLQEILLRYKNTVVFGEDVAQKGGVYHVTAGLFQKFGPKRVFNSILDETSILGTALGFAHNGFIPIPEIQFLAYLHNAEDQLRGEASTLSFFSEGRYVNPMVLRIAGLAYQKGFGGHFHNDNSVAVLRDLPGVIIGCPSNGRDAVMMMRTAVREAYENGRVVVMLEPIALYMTKDLANAQDNQWSFQYPEAELEAPIGEFTVNGSSKELAIISYGNGYYLSRQAAQDLKAKHNLDVKVIDLRWLAPLNEEKLAAELAGTRNILVVDECRKTASQSEGLMAMLVEKFGNGENSPKLFRITAEDCFIPLGRSATVLLPSREEIYEVAVRMLRDSEALDTLSKQIKRAVNFGDRHA